MTEQAEPTPVDKPQVLQSLPDFIDEGNERVILAVEGLLEDQDNRVKQAVDGLLSDGTIPSRAEQEAKNALDALVVQRDAALLIAEELAKELAEARKALDDRNSDQQPKEQSNEL